MRKRRIYDDDDGRTIADMSDVAPDNLLIPRGIDRAEKNASSPREEKPRPDYMDNGISRSERRGYIFGALGASLLIWLIYILGFALVVLLIVLIGK